MKKVVSVVLAICMIFPSLLTAFATVDGASAISGKITDDMTWYDGTVVEDVTIVGGTAEDPVEITINGTVTVTGQITLDMNAAANVAFKGNGTLISAAASSKALIWAQGGSFRHTLSIEGITLDGGAVWTGDNYQTLNRGNVNTGRNATGNGAVIFARYVDIAAKGITIQNQSATDTKSPAINIGYATLMLTDSVVRNNYHSTSRGGAIAMRNGAVLIAENTDFYGNQGATGGVIGTFENDAYNSVVKATDCKFYNNYANTGAVFCNQDYWHTDGIGELTLIGCEIYNNSSTKGLIYSHAYGVPTYIIDTKIYNNICSVYDYNQKNTNIFVSGNTQISAPDTFTTSMFACPITIMGELGNEASIELNEATITSLNANYGYIATDYEKIAIIPNSNAWSYEDVAEPYHMDSDDISKFSIDGNTMVLADVDGNNILDAVVVAAKNDGSPDVAEITITLKDPLDKDYSESYIVYADIASLPVTKIKHDGLTFAGWTDADGNAVTKQKITEATTLYASWNITAPIVKLSRVDATLTATVTNASEEITYSYQWYKANVAIDGATSSNYTMTDINSASYKCVVTASKEGYASVEGSASGTSSAPAAAQIGDTKYVTLKDAVAAANELESATVTVTKNITLGEKLTITGNVTITGNYTITRADNYTGTLFTVNAGSTLTLDGGLVIDGNNNYLFDKALYEADAADWNTKVPTADSAKWFTLAEGSTVAEAYMITTTGGTVNLKNVTIQNNYSTGSGVVSAGEHSTINLTGAKITHIAATQGNGVVVNASGKDIKVTMNEGTVIDGNHVGGNHGIFKIYSGAEFTMNGGKITNNTGWNSNGVAIGIYHAKAVMNNGTICSNISVYGQTNGRNSAVYVHEEATFEMNDGSICHNSARSCGGIDVSKSTSVANITGGEVINNISRGGIKNSDIRLSSAPDIGEIEITGGTFTQDVSKWLAPGYSLIYNEQTGTYIPACLKGSGTENDPYQIGSVEELIIFRDSVNKGEDKYNKDGVYVALTTDIDLAGTDWSVNIGDDCNATFDGIFDGKNHTISNLNSTETAQKADGFICTGLFGAIYGNAVIKNLTIENANINAGDYSGSNIGILVGFAYSAKGSIENVTIKGNIAIDAENAYAAGAIVGYNYYGTLSIKNCKVEATKDSYINADAELGGIIGYGASAKIVDCSVENLNLKAEGMIAGIAGLMYNTGSITNCEVNNVSMTVTDSLWINSAAVAIGTIAENSIAEPDVEYSAVTVNGTACNKLVGVLYTEKPSTTVPSVQAKLNGTYYATFDEALAAAEAGDTIEVLAPIVIESGENKIIDLKGVTVSMVTSDDKVTSLILNKGNLTITGEGKLSYKYTGTKNDDAFNTIESAPGSVLTIENGEIENLSENCLIAYAIDGLTNTDDKNVTININGGKISSKKIAVRIFANSAIGTGYLNINGGEINGRVIIQSANTKANKAALNITDGTLNANGYKTDVLYIGGPNGATADITTSITGGTFNGEVINFTAADDFISGGTFTQNVTEWVTPGFKTEQNANGTYGVVTDPAYGKVAMIGDNYYETLKDAVTAANASENAVTITLIDNTTVAEKLTIANDVTISGNFTITRADTYTGTLFTVNAGASLTLDGGLVIDGANEWTFDEDGFMAAYEAKTKRDGFAFVSSEPGAPEATAAMFYVSGNVVMNSATIKNHKSYGTSVLSVFYLVKNTGASLSMNDGAVVTHCATANSSTVASVNEKATFTINEGAVITDNFGAGHGAVARTDYGSIIMTGGLIKNNHAVNANGTVFMTYGVSGRRATFKMTGGEICTNIGLMGSGSTHVPAIYIHECADFVMNGGTICHNSGYNSGGVMAKDPNSSTLTISAGNIVNNEAKNYPDYADLYAVPKSCNITGGTFTSPIILDLAAPGFKVDQNDDGSFGVNVDPAYGKVAMIGETYYATLKEAIAAANAGDVITLIDNITVAEKLTIKKSVTIAGEYTITRGIEGIIFALDKNVTLTLDGGVIIDGGNDWTFDSENFYADMAAGKTLTTGAKSSYTASEAGGIESTAAMITISGTNGAVVMNNATIQNNWGSQLFSVPAGATLTINEGAHINNIRGSVAGQMSGTWIINDGKIENVHGHNTNGGLVDIRNSGKLTINGGEICYVTLLGINANGNGILAQVYGEKSKLTINGGYIHDNASFSPGGGWGSVVYLNRGGDFDMNGGIIEITTSDHCTAFVSNTSTAINLNAGTLKIEESTAARFDSLIYGDVIIGEEMIITGTGLAILLGNNGNKFENNGTIDCDVQIAYAEVSGNGTYNGNVTVKVDDYFGFDGNVIISGGTWNGEFTVEEGATLAITGGIFKNDVSEYVAGGYLLEQLPDGTYGIVEDPAYGKVAMIGDNYYETLKDAVTAANASENAVTITLIDNATVAEKLTIANDVTISGNFTITRADTYTGTLFTVNAGATLTLDGGLVIDGANEWTLNEELYNKALNLEVSGVTWSDLITSEEGAPNATAPMFKVTGSVIANDVTIQNNYSSMSSNNGDYGVFQVDANATLTMNGATIKHVVTGGANSVTHLSTNSVWTINDGTLITDTFAAKNGGICRNDGGLLVMNGGEISNNKSVNTNGTVVMLYQGAMEMNGGKICSNTGISGSNNSRCAPIYGHSSSTFIMRDGEICHNTGISYGGVDVPSSIKVEISGGFVGDNISALGNTNADVNGNSNTVISGGTFTQDVSKWIAPGCGLSYNEETKTYGIFEGNLYEYNGSTYASISEIIDVIKASGITGTSEITVINNNNIAETVVIDVDLVIDLNEKTLRGTNNIETMFRITNNADVKITTGKTDTSSTDGYIQCDTGKVFVVESGSLTIDDGKYKGKNTIVFVENGTLTVNYAKMFAAESDPALIDCNDENYVNSTAVVIINGGLFNKWNPSDNTSEGANTNFCAACHFGIANESGIYEVQIIHTVEEDDEATCTEPGICSVCGIELEAARGHVPSEAPNCLSPVYCFICEEKLSEKGSHVDENVDGKCDLCYNAFCETCGEIHDNFIAKIFCAIISFFKMLFGGFGA